MCFYITSTLPKDVDLEELKDIFNQFNMAFIPIQNQNIQSQLHAGELYFRATKNYCDCDTVLGSLNNLQEYQNLRNSQKVRSLKKKKWTDEQIDEWIKEKLQKEGSSTLGKKLTSMEIDKETKKWLNFLRSILNNKKVSRIGLLKHWYDKDLQTEEINLTRTEIKPIDKITPEFLLNLEEDVLYEFLPTYSF
ncbi:MAG: hypothetical protein EU533_08665 [Promethearchaeota archaeon]|nr:MAG: hypothetical protein EU533_08665 [Candidatus Lokiarchaeota archaeon]